MQFTNRQNKALTLAVLATLAMPVTALAATDEETTAKSRDIVVTASRTEQLVKETPAAVEVITREDIDKMGAESLAQALQLTIGLNVIENGMVGNQSAIRGGNTNQTLILIDGRRVRTENTSETQNYYELSRVNMDNVERIEIVRGAVSSLYGADALGGVINIITKAPTSTEGTATLDWTSKQKDVGVRMGFGRSGKWNWAASAKYTDIKRLGSAKSSNLYGDKYFFNINGRMDVDTNKKLDVFVDYLREEMNMIDSLTSKTTYGHNRVSTGIKYFGTDKLGDYDMQVYYTFFDKKQRSRNTSTSTLTDFDNMTFNSYIADGKRTIQAGDDHLITVGGEWRQEDYKSTRIDDGKGNTTTLSGLTSTVGKSSMDYAAIYLQDEWTVTPKWLVIPSVRWDYNDTFGSEVTAKLGTTYKLSQSTRFKANVGSAYRAPTASELYFNWTHSPNGIMTVNIKGNPDLKPEKSLNFDLGFEAEKGNAAAKLTYFHNKVDDLINLNTTYTYSYINGRQVPTYANGVYENIDKATLQGIEFENSYKFGPHFTLRGTYTYLDAMDNNDHTRLMGRARHKTSLQLQYVNNKGGVNATLWNDWLAGYGYTATVNRISYKRETNASILNFVVNKKFNDVFTAYFGISNLLDKTNDTLNYDGRIWRGGVKFNF